MSPAFADRRSAAVVARDLSPVSLKLGLSSPLCDPEFHPQSAARHVERLWRAHGGRWQDRDRVIALLSGVAQLAWQVARRDGAPPQPPFAIALAVEPRAIHVLLPEHSGHFGTVLVWLRHFEALLPAGAPACDLLFAARHDHAPPATHDPIWVWGRPPEIRP